MDKKQEKVLYLLVEHGRTEILKHFRVDSCIASTKIAIKVLKHFKINARPQPFSLEVMNPIYYGLFIKEKQHPKSPELQLEWANQGAWQVLIDSSNGEVGHIATIADEQVLIDMSIDQANRPAKSIFLEKPLIAILPPDWKVQKIAVYENKKGTKIVYRHSDNNMYRNSPNWKDSKLIDPIVKSIVRIIQRKM